MGLKTEYSYCEDDFAQSAEALNELTVTITLCEYRNLIREQARSEATIDALNDKVSEQKKSIESLWALIWDPDTFRRAGTSIAKALNLVADNLEGTAAAEADSDREEEATDETQK
jgi:hypothetical protein